MVVKNSGIGAVLIGFALALTHLSPDYVSRRLLDDGGFWLPELETIGQTVLLYNYVSRGIAFVLGFGFVFALGYWAGSQLDIRASYQRFVLALGLGGLIGYLIALVIFIWQAAEGSLLGDDLFLTLGLVLLRPIGVGVEFAVVGFAGAAFATLINESGPDGESTSTTSDTDRYAGTLE